MRTVSTVKKAACGEPAQLVASAADLCVCVLRERVAIVLLLCCSAAPRVTARRWSEVIWSRVALPEAAAVADAEKAEVSVGGAGSGRCEELSGSKFFKVRDKSG